MGGWHRLPPRPGRLRRRRRHQLPGRPVISPFTVHGPEPGDFADGDPSTVGADDDAPDFPCVDCTEYGECLDHEDEREAQAEDLCVHGDSYAECDPFDTD